MSEKIKITVVINNDEHRKEVSITHDINLPLMQSLIKERLIDDGFCGGRGYCKRCRVRFVDAAPLPTVAERSAFTSEELRQGYRLACMAKPRTDCVVCLELIKERRIEVITETADTADMVGVSGSDSVKTTEPMPENRLFTNGHSYEHTHERSYGHSYEHTHEHTCGHTCGRTYIIGVDLGTTTIAMQLFEMENGKAVDTYCAMNPQRIFGSDVLSRIQAANMGHAVELQESVWEVIHNGIKQFMDFVVQNEDAISCMCIAGNTTMEHLLMGLSTEGLGKSPFVPAERGLIKCTMEKYGFPIYITPVISAFVGGDIVAGLYYRGLLFSSEPAAVLFIDLGTNGEMAIVYEGRMIVTATAAGPAFEGGAGAGVPGSDMVAVTASLLRQGIIDETGLLKDAYFEKGVDVPISDGAKIRLTQTDIRGLQMAKAAVRAGVEILCKKAGNPPISAVCLAGGFGYFLDIDAAVSIGLLPESLENLTQAAGNTSLAGAYRIGKDLYTGKLSEDALSDRLDRIESINLAEEEGFEELYLSYIDFPAAN